MRTRAATERAQAKHLVGLIGEGIGSSLTPPLHEVEAAALGLDYEYRVLDLLTLGRAPEDLGALIADVVAEGYDAVNITHPCKQIAYRLVDEADDDAQRLGAVNLVLLREGRTIGYNTDWMGYRDGLVAGLPRASLALVVQLGCGGAGAATAYALLMCGAVDLRLVDADERRAQDLADTLQELFPSARVRYTPAVDLGDILAVASGVVHATPLGMTHHPGVAFDVECLGEGTWVSDVVYRPLETELIRKAAQRGLPVLDGGRMAVGQAFASMEIITGVRPDRQRMERHFRSLIEHESGAFGVPNG
ncbi:shikimate dehydrogenase [Microbacterium jiangjiandongii]|uniref:shikimate dehydrogenase n=1 Tax=Microbacterium jiangjiandongii TaxID=3049071 RepID=UPI00214BB8F2|nr:shikimate dehydrogenase [Microbacterium sp. zg.Y843]MCR2816659.1 shikimate dehydrogenase [Microbacterium sp. zg.Y843]